MGVNQGEIDGKEKIVTQKKKKKKVMVRRSNVFSTSIVRSRWRASSSAGHVPAAIIAPSASTFATLPHGVSNLRTYFLEITGGVQLTQWP